MYAAIMNFMSYLIIVACSVSELSRTAHVTMVGIVSVVPVADQ
jgi:hypothetical protein